ncbi:hypothetical protein D3C86_1626870 [compost metagenome]
MQLLHGMTQAFADHAGGFAAGSGEQYEKLFAAVTKHHVDVAQLAFQGGGNVYQALVADAVAVVVVDPLEVVEIEHQQRERLLVAARQIDFALQNLIHGNAVAGVGQRIA